MSDTRTILLAGEQARVFLHDLLADATYAVRVLTRDGAYADVLRRLGVEVLFGGLDDCASIRNAAQGCQAVFAAASDETEARNVIKVIAGSNVEQFVVAAKGAGETLHSYARDLGIDPLFINELKETTWRTTSLPFFL